MQNLETEFKTLADDVNKQIEAKLEEAMKALGEAVEIAEKHGVPFRTNISPLSQNYTPTTFKSLHPDLDTSFVSDLTETYDENDYEYGGWQFSAVCW